MIEVKKGDKVILKGFTGIKLGVFEVVSVTKKTVTLNKKNGDEMIFDRKTGKQINVAEGKERFANSIMEDDGSYVPPSTKGAAKKKASKEATKSTKPKKTTKKQPEPEVEDDDDIDDDDDFEDIDD
jgi:lactam utilization protein B